MAPYAPAAFRSPYLEKGDLGPAMKALPSDRMRAFVDFLVTTGTDNHTEAAQAAGYKGDAKTLHVTAHRLAHDSRVQAAIIEESQRRLLSRGLPKAVSTFLEIVGNSTHKDALKAATTIAAIAGISPVTKSVTETHTFAHGAPLLERIEGLLAQLPPDVAGRLRGELLPPKDITAEVVVVDEKPRITDEEAARMVAEL